MSARSRIMTGLGDAGAGYAAGGGWGALAGGLYGLLSGGSGSSGDKAQQVAALQLLLGRQLLDLKQREADIDLPFKSKLHAALLKRANQQTPRMLPGAQVISNPYRNLVHASLGPPQTFQPGRPAMTGPRQMLLQRALQNRAPQYIRPGV